MLARVAGTDWTVDSLLFLMVIMQISCQSAAIWFAAQFRRFSNYIFENFSKIYEIACCIIMVVCTELKIKLVLEVLLPVLVGLCSCRKMAFVARAAGKQQKIHSFAPLSEGDLMMEGNILKRDRQQFQINEELDLRTRLLMREAECIIKVTKNAFCI
jgi:hypothetical protein